MDKHAIALVYETSVRREAKALVHGGLFLSLTRCQLFVELINELGSCCIAIAAIEVEFLSFGWREEHDWFLPSEWPIHWIWSANWRKHFPLQIHTLWALG